MPNRDVRWGDPDLRKVHEAQKIVGKENAMLALDCIDYDPKFEPIFKSLFGTQIICPNISTARRVAFARGVQTRCVTLDGDSADPRGMMEGGSVANRQSALQVFYAYRQRAEELRHITREYEKIAATRRQLQKEFDDSQQMRNRIDLKKSQVENFTEQINQTSFQATLNEIEEIKVELAAKTEASNKAQEARDTLSTEVNDLTREIQDFEREKERKTKKMKEKIKKEKKQLLNMQKEFKALKKKKIELSHTKKNAESDKEDLNKKTLE